LTVLSAVGKVILVGEEWQFMWGRVPALRIAIKLPRFLPAFYRLKKKGAWGRHLCKCTDESFREEIQSASAKYKHFYNLI